jgi:hypothetical protein
MGRHVGAVGADASEIGAAVKRRVRRPGLALVAGIKGVSKRGGAMGSAGFQSGRGMFRPHLVHSRELVERRET